MPSHGIQVVTFDADGTIWDFQTTMREALAASLHDLQLMYPDEAAGLGVNDLITHRKEAEVAFRGQSMTMESLRFAAFMRTLDQIGIRDEHHARDLTRTYLERRSANARIFDDVMPARRAGMNVVWLNRTGADPPTGRQSVGEALLAPGAAGLPQHPGFLTNA
ncbi:hypothetical protein BH23CHL2_BH23CHL2_17880 [soil metagenome]